MKAIIQHIDYMYIIKLFNFNMVSFYYMIIVELIKELFMQAL